jgi:hypothetical protein
MTKGVMLKAHHFMKNGSLFALRKLEIKRYEEEKRKGDLIREVLG